MDKLPIRIQRELLRLFREGIATGITPENWALLRFLVIKAVPLRPDVIHIGKTENGLDFVIVRESRNNCFVVERARRVDLARRLDLDPDLCPAEWEIAAERTNKDAIFIVAVGTFGKADERLLDYAATLRNKVLHRLNKVVTAAGRISGLEQFTLYLAVSTDNPLDRGKHLPYIQKEILLFILSTRAERLSRFLVEGLAFVDSYSGFVQPVPKIPLVQAGPKVEPSNDSPNTHAKPDGGRPADKPQGGGAR